MRVVTFHNVVAEPLDIFDRASSRIHLNRFQRVVDLLRRRFEIVDFGTAMERLNEGTPDRGELVITFDDGFAGVYQHAFPVLSGLGLSATVFILTTQRRPIPAETLLHFEWLELAFRLSRVRRVDASELGLHALRIETDTDRVLALKSIKNQLKRRSAADRERLQTGILGQLAVEPKRIEQYASTKEKYRKLSETELNALLSAGWSIGGHTRTHPPLSSLDDAALEIEIKGNLYDLEQTFGLERPPFAYPYGSPELVGTCAYAAVQKAGFGSAFTMVPGENTPTTDRFQLNRFSDTALLASITVEGALRSKWPIGAAI
jgi:peptidoglycan/xylan/chitin deacetylase (PgdA/CDA1 family)